MTRIPDLIHLYDFAPGYRRTREAQRLEKELEDAPGSNCPAWLPHTATSAAELRA